MPEVEFVGDWSQAEAEAIATSIQKSLGVGEGGGAEVTVQDLEDNPVPGLLSKRQKRLIDLWREAGGHAFESAIAGNDGLAKSTTVDSGHECGPDCIHDWDEVYGLGSLTKAVTGALRRDEKGRTYQFNANGRWQRFEPGRGRGDIDPELRFFPEDGEFGKGVYLQVGEPSGWLRVRLRIDAVPAEMLTDEQFYELENDLTVSTGLLLTNKGVKAIAKTEGDRVSLLMVRNTGDIEVMGAIANSGQLPQGDHTYRLVRFSPQDDSIVADVEVAPREVEGLSKAAIVESKRLFAAGSPLNGSPLVASDEPVLSRQWVRAAVDRCKLDGVNLDGIKIRLTTMRPDFLPETAAFCLPRDRTIVLVAHDPEREINRLTEMLTRRLQAAVRAEAIAGDEALDILHKGTCLTPEWWLEMLIKRYAGAIRCFEVGCVMVESSPEVWRHYLGLLGARGGEHWANRRAIAECMAEDYRVAHDPAGLPNLVTLPWDVAVPEVARMAQNELLGRLTSFQAELSELMGDDLGKAGERAKQIMRWKGLAIGISHDPGDMRHGRKMKAGYGHIRGSYGDAEDGMALDVYIGPDLGSDLIFKIKQLVPDTGDLDEYKYVIGCWDKGETEALYLQHMPQQFFGGVVPVPLSELAPYQS